MALAPLLLLAALAIVHHPLLVNDFTDLSTLNRLQENEQRLTTEMGRLQVEMDQKNWDLKRNQERWTAEEDVGEAIWDGWPYVAVVILFLYGCCRRAMIKEPRDDCSIDGSSTTTTTTTGEEDFEDTDLEQEDYEFNQEGLEAFYEQHIETGDMSSLCDFVEMFVNDVLEDSRDQTLLLLEDCIGVGSTFEGWSTEISKGFCVLVPILPPKGHSFHIEISDFEGAPDKHGHISVEAECLCKRERLLGDVVCSLHHPQGSQEELNESIMEVLCTSSHLDAEKTSHWFEALVSKAWDTLGPKYNLNLNVQNSNRKRCQLKVELRSGKELFIDLLLGVQQGDTLIFLTTGEEPLDNLNGIDWPRTFAVQELLFFKWVSQRAPKNSCHLKCLQILIYFRESSVLDKKNPVLTNYHYKTCLMHLLFLGPLSSWEPGRMAPRLQDILLYMHSALEENYLEHFLIGNFSLPIQIPLPKSLRTAPPFNLFEYLARSPILHDEAVHEFVQVVEQVRTLWLAPEE